jgi:hypothetical protein
MKDTKDKSRSLLLAVLLSLSLGAAQARDEPMMEPTRISVEGRSGVDQDGLRKVLIRAGARRNWSVLSDAPGELQLKQSRGSKHEAVVLIKYDATGYQLSYASSYNLNADPERRRIHPTYNMWLRNLSADIESELTLVNLK